MKNTLLFKVQGRLQGPPIKRFIGGKGMYTIQDKECESGTMFVSYSEPKHIDAVKENKIALLTILRIGLGSPFFFYYLEDWRTSCAHTFSYRKSFIF